MGDLGEDLASKLRRVLYQHQVELETAAAKSTTTSEDNSSSDSNDPTLSYISRMLLDDESDEDDEVEQNSPEQYQVLMDELTTIIDSPPARVGFESGFVSPDSGAVDYHWALMQCARAVAANNTVGFFSLVAELKRLMSPVPSVVERMAVFFIDALRARLAGTGAQAYRALAASLSTRRLLSMRMLNLPGFTITHHFGNEVILRACKGSNRVHIVDYGIHCGFQWPSLIKAFAERPEGAPQQLRITGIELPSEVEASQTGQRLIEYANSFGLNLIFTLVWTSSWETVQPRIHPGETLIINSNLRESNMKDDFLAMNNPRRLLLERIHRMQPKIFVQCCCSVALSTPFFLPRFEELLKYVTCKLEYSETWVGDKLQWRDLMEKTIAKNIMNVVACDGVDWDFRPESYKTWDSRAKRAGLVQVPLDDEIYNKVKLVWGGYKNTSENFCCGRDENWMLVGWKNRVLTGMCAWRPRNIK